MNVIFSLRIRSRCIDYIKQMAPLIDEIKVSPVPKGSTSSVSVTFLSDQERVILNFDDAVQVLCSITPSPSVMPFSR